MIPLLSDPNDSVSIIETLKGFIGLVATCLGLIVILIGLRYALQIFHLVFTILNSPSYLNGVIHEMAESIGGRAFDLRLDGRAVPLANLMALTVYCCAAFLVAWLTLALMHTGAKIVSLTAGDRYAVKQLMKSAFEKSLQPKSAVSDRDAKPRTTARHPS